MKLCVGPSPQSRNRRIANVEIECSTFSGHPLQRPRADLRFAPAQLRRYRHQQTLKQIEWWNGRANWGRLPFAQSKMPRLGGKQNLSSFRKSYDILVGEPTLLDVLVEVDGTPLPASPSDERYTTIQSPLLIDTATIRHVCDVARPQR